MKEAKQFNKNFIWNTIGSTLNAFNSLFFLIVVTRINGLEEAGIFTLAFSTGCILYVIGIYAGRVYQVTEKNKNITDKDFIVNRIISCFIMIIALLFFVAINKYDFHKMIIFIIIIIYRACDSFSEVLFGILQKNDKLDIVGKSFTIKSLVSLLVFIIIDLITKNLVLATISIPIVWILVIVSYDRAKLKGIYNNKQKCNKKNVIEIFIKGFFTFAITFLGLYLANAQKYSIDIYETENIQALFGIIIMPASVMVLASQFLIHPYLNNIASLVKENAIDKIKKIGNKINIELAIFGIVSIVLAYFLGMPILKLVYGVDLGENKINLCLIILGGILYSIGYIQSVILISLRYTGSQLIIYAVLSIFTLIISNTLTKSNQINGAVLAYVITMLIYCLIYIAVINIFYKKKMNIINESKN